MRQIPLAPEKLTTEFIFQLPDGAAKRGHTHATLFRRAGKIQRLPRFEEVAYLVHFHDERPVGHIVRRRHLSVEIDLEYDD